MYTCVVFLIIGLALTNSAYSVPEFYNCGTTCSTNSECCVIGGCYLGLCTNCRLEGNPCESSGQCCNFGGCVNNQCVVCRESGLRCEVDSQCCGGRRCEIFRTNTDTNTDDVNLFKFCA